MMEYSVIIISSFLASWISFYSGFGLGTILMPVIAVFFPLPIAISLTAVAHLIHSLFKVGMLWSKIDWKLAFKFGSIALLTALLGAWLLKKLAFLPPITHYHFVFIKGEISLLKLWVGFLLILFASIGTFASDLLKINNLFIGGALSGFLGGLTGNQGAFRSFFLTQTGLEKEVFIATSAIVSLFVDVVRLIMYAVSFQMLFRHFDKGLLALVAGGATLGVCLGMMFLKKVPFTFIQKLIIALLYILGVLLVLGVI